MAAATAAIQRGAKSGVEAARVPQATWASGNVINNTHNYYSEGVSSMKNEVS